MELNDNKISGDDLSKLLVFKKLMSLKICNNKISTLEHVLSLKPLESLHNLDLSGNPVCETESYREKVFEAMPQLVALDGKDRDGQSVMSEDDYGEEGEFDLDEQL